MQNCNMGSLTSWSRVTMGELLAFDVPAAGVRKVEFDLISDADVSVSAVNGDEAYLIGYGSGLRTIKFTIDRGVAVVVNGDANCECFIRTLFDHQVIPESLDPSFTTIEPRNAGPSDEVKRMMHLMRLNEQRREKQLAADRAALQAEVQTLRQAREAPAEPPAQPADPISGEVIE